MSKFMIQFLALLMITFGAHAQQVPEPASTDESAQRNASQDDGPQGEATESVVPDGLQPDRPKTMSGMSILGNEEAPKSLVIVPWKSSQLGDDPDVSGSLDERATPVDREVFLRELSYYDIRSGQ